eukprot:scaffold263622_cov17-Prasinocladus_malaysianus.AAC.1
MAMVCPSLPHHAMMAIFFAPRKADNKLMAMDLLPPTGSLLLGIFSTQLKLASIAISVVSYEAITVPIRLTFTSKECICATPSPELPVSSKSQHDCPWDSAIL